MRASFSSAIIPANVGDAADVPPMCSGRPRRKMRNLSACAETSGIAYRTETTVVLKKNSIEERDSARVHALQG